MATKNLLYRFFGIGGLSKKVKPMLENEGIVLIDEGIPSVVTLRGFRGPGRYHSYKKSWFPGNLVLTELRFAAFAFSKPLINVGREHEKFSAMELELPDPERLIVRFEASDFQDRYSGRVEVRFTTPLASSFHEHLLRV